MSSLHELFEGLPRGTHHEFLYGDPKRVREARIQAKGRIAARALKAELARPALAVLNWVYRVW